MEVLIFSASRARNSFPSCYTRTSVCKRISIIYSLKHLESRVYCENMIMRWLNRLTHCLLISSHNHYIKMRKSLPPAILTMLLRVQVFHLIRHVVTWSIWLKLIILYYLYIYIYIKFKLFLVQTYNLYLIILLVIN